MSSMIAAENLSKRYILGHQRDPEDGLRHALENAFRNPIRWLRDRQNRRQSASEEFWALRNVSFTVAAGEVVGIIGRNGAGKSTLLKLLSRITEPTQGRIHLRGRVASLLEVGTGFHQELTGRENIFLNGAILGMSRNEILRKFDEIVAFSGVERFLDTPVKRYSSGMYVRLAFAVAAHLEPEILIVDEVLAVGDAAFQKKCLGKMGEVAKGGRTVLFVSHNMAAVRSLCSRGIYLNAGAVRADGRVDAVLSQYLQESGEGNARRFDKPVAFGPHLVLQEFEVTPARAKSGEPRRLSLKFHAKDTIILTDLAVLIYSAQNVRAAILDLRCVGMPLTIAAGKNVCIEACIKSLAIVEGEYSVGLYISATGYSGNTFDSTTLSVDPNTRESEYAPYASMDRGYVELEYTATAAFESKVEIASAHALT